MTRLTKPIAITIDGIERKLTLDMTAMRDFEDTTGKHVLPFVAPFFKTFRDLQSQGVFASGNSMDTGIAAVTGILESDLVTAGELAALFWACLGGEDSGLTLREAGRLIRPDNIAEIGMALWQTIQGAMPTGGDDSGDSTDPN